MKLSNGERTAFSGWLDPSTGITGWCRALNEEAFA